MYECGVRYISATGNDTYSLSVCVCSPFQLSFQHKVGVLYCKAGQSTEEEMYNNESAGPALEEFLDLLGQRVRLKGFTKYRAQLDNKSKIPKNKLNLHKVQAHKHTSNPAECRCSALFHIAFLGAVIFSKLIYL